MNKARWSGILALTMLVIACIVPASAFCYPVSTFPDKTCTGGICTPTSPTTLYPSYYDYTSPSAGSGIPTTGSQTIQKVDPWQKTGSGYSTTQPAYTGSYYYFWTCC